jgi:hypothetical protein
MGMIDWTPAVQAALNTKVINSFGAGFGRARVSDLLQVCGIGDAADADKYVALIVGKDFAMNLRAKNSDEIEVGGQNVYESRGEVGNYQRWIWLARQEALFDNGINKLVLISASMGESAAEQPSRMIEAAVPIALEAVCHTGESLYDAAHPIKPGSATTFANRDELGALDFDSYDEAVVQFAQIPDEDGRAGGSKPDVLAVGPGNEQMGREILLNRVPLAKSGGENTRIADGRRLVVVPDWPTNFWTLFDTSSPDDRAFYYCEAIPFTVSPIETDPNGPYAKKHNRIEWCVDGWAAMVLGNPRRTFMSVAAADVATIIANAKAKMKLNKFDFALS